MAYEQFGGHCSTPITVLLFKMSAIPCKIIILHEMCFIIPDEMVLTSTQTVLYEHLESAATTAVEIVGAIPSKLEVMKGRKKKEQ